MRTYIYTLLLLSILAISACGSGSPPIGTATSPGVTSSRFTHLSSVVATISDQVHYIPIAVTGLTTTHPSYEISSSNANTSVNILWSVSGSKPITTQTINWTIFSGNIVIPTTIDISAMARSYTITVPKDSRYAVTVTSGDGVIYSAQQVIGDTYTKQRLYYGAAYVTPTSMNSTTINALLDSDLFAINVDNGLVPPVTNYMPTKNNIQIDCADGKYVYIASPYTFSQSQKLTVNGVVTVPSVISLRTVTNQAGYTQQYFLYYLNNKQTGILTLSWGNI